MGATFQFSEDSSRAVAFEVVVQRLGRSRANFWSHSMKQEKLSECERLMRQ